MSDPVTNVEIEDVLSSIRRLVSEDARVRPVDWQADPASPVAAPEATPEVGRLVLTPALRVNEDPVSPEPVAEAPEPVAEDAAEQGGQTPAPEVAIQPEADEHPQHDSREDTAEQDDLAAQTTEAEPEHDSDAPAFAGQDDQPADEGQAPYVLSAADDAAMVWEDHHDAEQQDSEMTPDSWTDVVVDEGSDTFEDEAAPLMDTASVPEDAAFVFATSRDGAAREAASAASDASHGDDDPLDDRAFLLREDEAILDEETLREMVAEIVRQELQGALGERITRNVRKLVRREIHRALTSHELD